MQCFFCLISAQFALIFSHFDLSLAVLRETSTLCLKKDPCIRESSWINNTLSISMTSLRCILYWLCLYTSMPAVYLYFVQFIHDLCSQLPGVKGWKLEGQINVHCGAKPVTSHSHVNLHAEEGQSCTEGGNVRMSELKRSLSWRDEIRHPWMCFCGHHLLSLQGFPTIKLWHRIISTCFEAQISQLAHQNLCWWG